jgi:hypothetical protein
MRVSLNVHPDWLSRPSAMAWFIGALRGLEEPPDQPASAPPPSAAVIEPARPARPEYGPHRRSPVDGR